jgi:hypothetical protein
LFFNFYLKYFSVLMAAAFFWSAGRGAAVWVGSGADLPLGSALLA